MRDAVQRRIATGAKEGSSNNNLLIATYEGHTHSCLIAIANSGVNRLQVATSLLRSYVPASYVE